MNLRDSESERAFSRSLYDTCSSHGKAYDARLIKRILDFVVNAIKRVYRFLAYQLPARETRNFLVLFENNFLQANHRDVLLTHSTLYQKKIVHSHAIGVFALCSVTCHNVKSGLRA